MKHFPNIGSMCAWLRVASKELPGYAGREELKRQVQEQLEFTPQQADVYVTTLLSRNLEDSPDNAKANADALFGTWTWMEQTGNPLGWMKTVTETWHFRDDLNYEHKIKSYAGAVTTGPFFQSSYSSPSVNIDRGDLGALGCGAAARRRRGHYFRYGDAAAVEVSLGGSRRTAADETLDPRKSFYFGITGSMASLSYGMPHAFALVIARRLV